MAVSLACPPVTVGQPAEGTQLKSSMIIIVTRGTSGDVLPFIALGTMLRARGNDVLIITHCHYEAQCARAGIRFEPLDTPEEFKAFVNDTCLLDTPTGFEQFANRHIFRETRKEMSLLERYCDRKCVLVARHMSSLAVSMASELWCVPLVSVFASTAQANCFEMWVELCRLVMAKRINECRKEVHLAPINDWKEWANRPTTFFACWPEWFSAATGAWPTNTRHVGFLWNDTVEDGFVPAKAQEALSHTTESILITGGTSTWGMARRFYSVASDACTMSRKVGILVCRHDECVPRSLPPGVTRFAELPFAHVMPRVAAVIHHGGFGTMLRAMISGTPQIILPFGADRPENAKQVEALGIGVRLEPSSWTPIQLATAINRVVTDRELPANVANVRESVLAECRIGSGVFENRSAIGIVTSTLIAARSRMSGS